MISTEETFLSTFSASIDELLERSPFFTFWQTGNIRRTVADKFLMSFDGLVQSFPSLIALGAARAGNECTRIVLAVNLFDECGRGSLKRTHHAIFRRFLQTAGIAPTTESSPEFSDEWRTGLHDYIRDAPTQQAALGALAAGEFLAQPVLSRIFSVLEPLYPKADTEYFTTHLELETEHVREISELLTREVACGASPDDVVAGFRFGLAVWEKYFDNLYEYLVESDVLERGSSK